MLKKERLRQPGRPQHSYYISQNLGNDIFAEKKAPAAAGKTSTKLSYIKNLRNAIFAGKKVPAAAGKTSTKLLYITKYQARRFCRTKKRLRQPGRPQQSYHISKNLRNAIFAEKKAPAAAGKIIIIPSSGKRGFRQVHRHRRRCD